MTLRDYQVKGLTELRDCYRRGVKRVLFHMATGGGKTKCFSEVLKGAHAKGTMALVVVRGRKLIRQASLRLTRDGVPHGIIMAGAENATFERIRVCSIDTLYSRRHAPEAQLIVIDEAHQTTGDGYKWFLEQYPHALILAVTATPHLKRGMRHVADEVVRPITAKELTDQGYLVPLRYWTPEKPDLTGVTTSGDDYNQKELGVAMRKAALSGNVVQTYQSQGGGRRAILFAVDIEHSRQLVAQFTAQKIPAAHIDASCTDNERDRAVGQLERGEIRILANVGVLTTGVDVPAVDLIIMARPTKSYNLWIQMIGRGTRPCPDVQKTDCYVFDHAGNVERHGLLEQERQCELDGKVVKDPPQIKQCGQCFSWAGRFESVCPACGAAFREEPKGGPRKKDSDETAQLKAYALPPWEEELHRLVSMGKRGGYKPGFVYHRMKSMYGSAIAKAAWKRLKENEPSWVKTKALSTPP
jgi:DNA repair protein RadD